jgi:hypothetical protein
VSLFIPGRKLEQTLGIVQGIAVSATPCLPLDDAFEDYFRVPPPALSLAEKPVLILGILVEEETFEEFAAQQVGRFIPALSGH